MADCSSPLPVAAARRLGTTNPSDREGVSPRVESSRDGARAPIFATTKSIIKQIGEL